MMGALLHVLNLLLLRCAVATMASLRTAIAASALGGVGAAAAHYRPSNLVSIIIPVYDRPALLELALEQVGRTSYGGDIEVVVVDDSERAADADALSARLLPSPKHKLLYRHDSDRRYTVGEKRNAACELSSGDVIVMMDDDDVYHPDRIAYQVSPILDGSADMTVLNQGVWVQFRGDGRAPKFYEAVPRMAASVHYGTLAFRRGVWNPDLDVVYTNASLLDEVDFYNKVKEDESMKILELPNRGMHVYVRHPGNINRPGSDLARDRRFVRTDKPLTVSGEHMRRLDGIFAKMHGIHDAQGRNDDGDSVTKEERKLQASPEMCVKISDCYTLDDCYDMYSFWESPELAESGCDEGPPCDCADAVPWTPPETPPPAPEWTHQCGACVDVNGPCVTADECWDMYNGDYMLWDMCVDSSTVTPCESCERTSPEVCESRCVAIGSEPCLTFEGCYNMYAGYPSVDCNRFPSCDCAGAVPWTKTPTSAPTPEWTHQCGACVDVNGPCVTADECWDMYKGDYSYMLWDMCMDSSTVTPCEDCERSSGEVCESRCVAVNGPCVAFEDCYNMYADSGLAIDCDRFPSCDCAGAVPRDDDDDQIVDDDTGSSTTVAQKCGACVDVGFCVTADECWDMYKDSPALRWEMCMDSSTIMLCSDCERSSDDVCESRCVDNFECQTLASCYDMYAEFPAPEVDCNRFPSCECSTSADKSTQVPSARPSVGPSETNNDPPPCCSNDVSKLSPEPSETPSATPSATPTDAIYIDDSSGRSTGAWGFVSTSFGVMSAVWWFLDI